MTARERIKAKTNSRCAYCGARLGDRWHVDHMAPLWRGRGSMGGDDTEGNKIASCPRCNRWKSTYSIEQFRQEIKAQFGRLYRDSAAFRLAADFQMVEDSDEQPVFWFEKCCRKIKP